MLSEADAPLGGIRFFMRGHPTTKWRLLTIASEVPDAAPPQKRTNPVTIPTISTRPHPVN